MSRMTRLLKISSAGAGAAATLTMACLYGLFHGYFDPGHFELKRFEWSSTGQVAMVAERLDDYALGGLQYYVLIGDHLFTAAELRRALYSDAVVFSGPSDCLTVRWDSPNRLTIRCNGAAIDRDHINAERQRIGDVAISYENIATK